MRLINPSLISGEIMNLIEEADEKVILISPYFNLRKWDKFLNKIDALKKRKLEVEIYVREHEQKSIDEVRAIGFTPVLIPYLHTKLYLNEKYAIVSSMNLLLSSDEKSLDIAMRTETADEYQNLVEYYKRYIKSIPKDKPFVNPKAKFNLSSELDISLTKLCKRKIYLYHDPNKITINTQNRYEACIQTSKKNILKIAGVLSRLELDFAERESRYFRGGKIAIELVKGGKGCYDTIWGYLENVKSYNINELLMDEGQIICEAIVEFISRVERLKLDARNFA